MSFETLEIKVENSVAEVVLNRPDKANAMNRAFWTEIKQAFEELDQNSKVRVIILRANGKHFSSGIDLSLLGEIAGIAQGDCPGRAREDLRRLILSYQGSFTALEKCRKPVIAAIQGACIGGALDLISACDFRFCTTDSFFSIKEVEIGMTADVGTLQRLPKIIPDGIMRELAYTGRSFEAVEAERIGLVNRYFENQEKMIEEVKKIAEKIASNSPLAVRGTKEMILYSRDHSVEEGLNYVATWNAAMLLSADIPETMLAKQEKRKPDFQN